MAAQSISASDYVSYAQKFWDAGNLSVTLIFGLAFACYYVLATNRGALSYAYDHIWWLVGLSLIGNLGIGVVIWRFYTFESTALMLANASDMFTPTIFHAYCLRLWLVGANTVIYLTVLAFVWRHGPYLTKAT